MTDHLLNPVDFDPFAGHTIEKVIPLTESQQEIWLSCLLGGTDANLAYNESVSLDFNGNFQPDTLKESLTMLLTRHESLRASFSTDGRSMIIYDSVPLNFKFIDLSTLPVQDQVTAIGDFHHKNAETPFNLSEAPLIQFTLFKESDSQYLFTIKAHHIICDGWSLGTILKDLSELYNAYCNNTALPNRPPAYTDYVKQLLTFAKTTEQIKTEHYWLDKYKNNVPQLALPTDFPRPTIRTYRSRRDDYRIDKAFVTKIKHLGTKAGSSFVTTLLTAYEVFICRLTGQDDIVIGLPTAGQPVTAHFDLVGHCVNLLPIKSKINGQTTFLEHLKRRKSEILNDLDHQRITFGTLIKTLNIKRDPSQVPLVSIVFNIDMGMDTDVSFQGVTHRLISNPRECETFDIFLNVSGSEDALTLEWSYNTQLFKPATIASMMEGFTGLLNNIIAEPTVKLADIKISKTTNITEPQYTSPMFYPKDKPFTAYITEIAAANPLKTAISFNGIIINYRELEERSNQLANYLITKNVTAGDIIGVAMDRSIDMVIALLGVVKSGAAYIPLDPQYPINRVEFMLQDSSAKFLLTESKYSRLFSSEAKELFYDELLASLESYPTETPKAAIHGNDLVYVLYTSGSTGKPKGVQIEHCNLVNLLLSMQREPGMSAGDKLLALTTISFDIAGLELYLPLISGATIILADADTQLDSNRILQLIKSQSVTVLQATPATWRMMLKSGWSERLTIKSICGGEAFPPDLAEKLLKLCDEVWNAYGPTETTIYSIIKRIRPNELPITIGKPIHNTRAYILDETLSPLGVGHEGEIYIGGDGVARGYLNRPELNIERFLSDPFTTDPSARLYRTGDLGKILPNGEIQCLGRMDTQVKIRGFRIELGEIEYHLTKQKGIKEAVVIAREDRPGDQRLVAYILPSDSKPQKSITKRGTLADKESVKSWKHGLTTTLPTYMIPNDWVLLSEFPLTSNKKIERKALPKPSSVAVVDAHADESTLTANEQKVFDIWASIFKTTDIQKGDDFFELGGHSLLAIEVITQVEKSTGVSLPLTTLFKYPVLSDFAALLNTNAIDSDEHHVDNDTTDIKNDEQLTLPTIESQREIWVACALGGEEANKAYNIPFSLVLEGMLDVPALKRSFQQLIARHEALRATFSEDGAEMYIHNQLPFTLDQEDISSFTAQQQEQHFAHFLKANAEKPFDLLNGPLMRAILFKLGNSTFNLLLTIHHIICDGWSISIIAEELGTLYTANCKNKVAELQAAPRISEYMRQKHTFYQSTAYHAIGDYWVKRFKDDTPVLELPIDHPRSKTRNYQSSRCLLSISSSRVSLFRKVGIKGGSSMAINFMALLEILLYRLTGSSDTVIGFPVAGQLESHEYNKLIGHCVNTLAIRSQVVGDMTFSEYLKNRRSTIIEDYQHQQYTLGSLVQRLNIVRDPSRIPLIPFLFSYDNEEDDRIKFEGIDCRLRMESRHYDNFEIVLNAAATEDGLQCSWTFNTALFSAERIQSFHEQLERLMDAVSANPYTPINELQVYSESELQSLQRSWNADYVEIPVETTLVNLFEEAVVAHSTRSALCFDGKLVTYQALNTRANRLAHLLIGKGVKPGTPVGLALDRSFDLIAAIIAIIKAGATYVPLDLTFPKERITSIIHNAQIGVVFTNQAVDDQYPADVLVLHTEKLAVEIANYLDSNPKVSTGANPLIYILHTSGSTGQPKGVCLGQEALVNLLLWQREHSSAGSGSSTLQFAPVTFDVSFQEIFATLITGGCLHLIREELRLDIPALLDYLKQKEINRMFLPFVALHALAENAEATNLYPAHLTEVMTAGEQLKITPQIVKLFNNLPQAKLYNQYGPTEAHVVTELVLSGDPNQWPSLPSIGKPIYNTRILILNEQLSQVLSGAVGELCIAGKCLAKGYLNLSSLTAEKFTTWTDPNNNTIRIYRTGDLARLLPDGNIEYLGRNDSQVKIRGYRIELGEIEALLNKSDDIKQAVASTQLDNRGIKRLVAYVILNGDGKVINPERKASWKRLLQAYVPEYMIPYDFAQLDELPLTSSGKIDRKALPAIEISTERTAEKIVMPATNNEKLIAGIWSDILGIQNIGIHDNFFELGGYSLIAVKVMLAIEKQTGKHLPLASLFDSPTIEKLALLLNDKGSVKWGLLVPIKPDGHKPPLYIVHGAGMNVLVFQPLANYLDPEQPVYGLQAKGLDGTTAPTRTVEEIAEEYVGEIRKHNSTGPYAIAGYSSGGTIAIEMARQLRDSGADVKFVGLIDSYPHNIPSDYQTMWRRGIFHFAYFIFLKLLHVFIFLFRHPGTYIKDRYNYARGFFYGIFKRFYPDVQLIDTEPPHVKAIQKAHEQALRQYVMPHYESDVWLFRTTVKTSYFLNYGTNAWNTEAFGNFHVININGEHGEIFKQPFVHILADKLQAVLTDEMSE